jgi:hypothetical protein
MRDTNFTKVPNELLRSGQLHPYEILIYLYLKSRQGANEHSWPSQARIASELCISVSSVKTYLNALERLRMIRRTARFVGGERIPSYYKTFPIPRWLYEGQPRPSTDEGGFSDGYEEDSVQEDSVQEDINSPSMMSQQKKSWRNLRSDRPPTEKQLEFINSMAADADDPCRDEVDDFMANLDSMSQVDANLLIERRWVDLNMVD